ncbi:threonine/serine exporter family protein [uncultured Tolumonas sp.]|uniref:threonine/serine exporter family protein n=1 Tax=uncultured Tolumonas sp. TaxID=263765 RepID=UPI002A0A70E1|nr:threonine/serine exporter family protein [uncultured Tolumonas sp.]
MMELLRAIVFDAFWSAIPAVGFAMIFAVPPRMLKYCAAGGAFAHSLRMLQIHFGMPIEWATFITTTLVGLIFVYVSRRLLAPRPVFTVASIIPMIPGKFAFNTIIAVLSMNSGGVTEKLLQASIENGLKTLFILFALCFGLAVPSLFIYRNRPIV